MPNEMFSTGGLSQHARDIVSPALYQEILLFVKEKYLPAEVKSTLYIILCPVFIVIVWRMNTL